MKPFIPQILPLSNIDYTKFTNIIDIANRSLAVYNGMLRIMIDPNILLAPFVSKEAVFSTRIEGTQVSMMELMENEADRQYNKAKQDDIDEVINYKKTMAEAEILFKDRPFIHLNMIRDLHGILLTGVRGNNKARGEFRKVQIYIGTATCSLENATYIPPEAHNVMPALDNWEKYINNYDEQEVLIQCAIMHAQFEIIHPFLDGNGRLGRILIPLFLYQKNYIDKPLFYLSEYFESHREEYYKYLNNITSNGDWISWIEFFLRAVREQADRNIDVSIRIMELHKRMETVFREVTNSILSLDILNGFFKKPIIDRNELMKLSGIKTASTINTILPKLIDAKLITLKENARGNKPAIYSFDGLLSIIG